MRSLGDSKLTISIKEEEMKLFYVAKFAKQVSAILTNIVYKFS